MLNLFKGIVGEGLKNPKFLQWYNQIIEKRKNPTIVDLHKIMREFTERDPVESRGKKFHWICNCSVVEAEEEIPLDIQLQCTLFTEAKVPFISIVFI